MYCFIGLEFRLRVITSSSLEKILELRKFYTKITDNE